MLLYKRNMLVSCTYLICMVFRVKLLSTASAQTFPVSSRWTQLLSDIHIPSPSYFDQIQLHLTTLAVPYPQPPVSLFNLLISFSIQSTLKWIKFMLQVRLSPPLPLMLFLPSANHVLAVDLWPSPYNTIIEQRATIPHLQQWECFPPMLDRLVEWATVTKHPSSLGNARDRLLVYKTLPTSDTEPVYYPVSVRLFGFLEDFCLGDYGDWKGFISTIFLASWPHVLLFDLSNDNWVKHAVQSLSLTSGGHTVAWQNQLDRLNMACTLASCLLKLPLLKVQFSRRLYMQRRVFTKVCI